MMSPTALTIFIGTYEHADKKSLNPGSGGVGQGTRHITSIVVKALTKWVQKRKEHCYRIDAESG